MTLLLITIMVILLVTIFIGTPVGFALGFVGVAITLLYLEPSHLAQIGSIIFNQGTSMNQLVAPLFILMAEALAHGNVATDIFLVLNKWLRKFKGGLALSATLAATVFAALCGSSPATAAAIGRVSINEMTKRGYSPDFATGVVAAGGALGIMIPPSITFVIYGIITENSISKLFIAGIVPGLMISALLCLFIILRVKMNPSIAGETFEAITGSDEPENSSGLKQDLKLILPPLALVAVVIGSLYSGLTTPTEASGFGAVGALLLVFLLGRFNSGFLTKVTGATASTSSVLIFLVFGGMSLSYVVSYLGIAQNIADAIISASINKWIVLLLVYILWFIMGCLMDPLSMVVLTIPFIYPTFMALGFDPLWLGVVSTLAVEIGMITPPVGLNLFIIKAISDVPMGKIMAGALPFVFVLIFALILLTIFPQIALFLPSMM
ncbi:MAG: TRAP transporter large permease [Thermincola sp.]|nr:TRAP transporter large permease [Thermincola sp.]MDT3702818.1 TRAP transporter large permease [Thermincola sp.]